MDKSFRQRMYKETVHLNNTVDQKDPTDIYRTFYPTTAEYTFFRSAHGTLSSIDCMLSHKTSRSKFQKIQIIPRIFSDQNNRKLLETNNKKKKIGKFTWK